MKKLLALLGATSMSVATSFALIACSKTAEENNEKITITLEEIQSNTQITSISELASFTEVKKELKKVQIDGVKSLTSSLINSTDVLVTIVLEKNYELIGEDTFIIYGAIAEKEPTLPPETVIIKATDIQNHPDIVALKGLRDLPHLNKTLAEIKDSIEGVRSLIATFNPNSKTDVTITITLRKYYELDGPNTFEIIDAIKLKDPMASQQFALIANQKLGVSQESTIAIVSADNEPYQHDISVTSSDQNIVSASLSETKKNHLVLKSLKSGNATIKVNSSQAKAIEFNVTSSVVNVPVIQPIKDQKIIIDDSGAGSVNVGVNIIKPADYFGKIEVTTEPPSYGTNVYPQKNAVTSAKVIGDMVRLTWEPSNGYGQDTVTIKYDKAKPVTFKVSVYPEKVKLSNPPGKGKSYFETWDEANPNRLKSNQITKAKANESTYFSPYIDAALYQGDRVEEVLRQNPELRHMTLSFAAQDANQKDKLDISFAGIDKSSTAEWEAYWWYLNKKLIPDILKPLSSRGIFRNTKISYGGYNACMEADTYLPWVVANRLANGDTQKAEQLLADALIKFQKEVADLVNERMTKAIDFDIEGHAQQDKYLPDNRLLARTLANMVKVDKEWDFSLTVAVLPDGLVEGPNKGYQVVDTFISEYQKAGVGISQLPKINPMLMDYGNEIYEEATAAGLTNADLAITAMESTMRQIQKSINQHYNANISDADVYAMMGATPMSGVNDTEKGIFTLEDAKDVYNWAQETGINYIGMWSINDDRGLTYPVYIDVNSFPEGVIGGQPANKAQTTHGLLYLNEYDFTKVYTGDWDLVQAGEVDPESKKPPTGFSPIENLPGDVVDSFEQRSNLFFTKRRYNSDADYNKREHLYVIDKNEEITEVNLKVENDLYELYEIRDMYQNDGGFWIWGSQIRKVNENVNDFRKFLAYIAIGPTNNVHGAVYADLEKVSNPWEVVVKLATNGDGGIVTFIAQTGNIYRFDYDNALNGVTSDPKLLSQNMFENGVPTISDMQVFENDIIITTRSPGKLTKDNVESTIFYTNNQTSGDYRLAAYRNYTNAIDQIIVPLSYMGGVYFIRRDGNIETFGREGQNFKLEQLELGNYPNGNPKWVKQIVFKNDLYLASDDGYFGRIAKAGNSQYFQSIDLGVAISKDNGITSLTVGSEFLYVGLKNGDVVKVESLRQQVWISKFSLNIGPIQSIIEHNDKVYFTTNEGTKNTVWVSDDLGNPTAESLTKFVSFDAYLEFNKIYKAHNKIYTVSQSKKIVQFFA
ncbi:lipoprotein [Mesoplasma seiffertii]|uniref:lipoprotein n=1 Tax=Mesoplasma seiffertii TaxID=28224 RepID=UPI00047A27E5|nr:lipoprotein [Mesoplasma seiffertii]